MQNELTFPYRRFSSDMYASSLIELLDESAIPFEIVSEPESIGSVFLGVAGVPGIIVMVRPADAQKVYALENPHHDKESSDTGKISADTKKDDIHPGRLFLGYLLILFVPIGAFLFGLRLILSRQRVGPAYEWTYKSDTRFHGKIFFAAGLFFSLIGIIQFIEDGNYMRPLFFILSFID